MKTTTLQNSVNRSHIGLAFLLVSLAWLALSPGARADCLEGCDGSNTFLGNDALLNNTIGGYNTAVGFNALLSNTLGNYNTGIGYQALLDNTEGILNTATGSLALHENTTGDGNTATGTSALLHNVAGDGNTATGAAALELNQGDDNTATGTSAMLGNQTGNDNTATGRLALGGNFSGSSNTATGSLALLNNQVGSNNTADGANALKNNANGNFNTGVGDDALLNNKKGSFNIALGADAGKHLKNGDGNIYIGNEGIENESKTIRIGESGNHNAAFVAGISGATVPTGVAVIIDTDGHLGTVLSSERFKDAIKPMDKASEAVLALEPVMFHYKKDLDPKGIPQFGLVAEQVEKVNPDLVARDEQGKPYTVRYEAVNAMLLNEFLKEHRTVQLQQKEIDTLKTELKEQRSLIQKVSARLELSRPAAQTVVGNQ
jgi:hypothetical protein